METSRKELKQKRPVISYNRVRGIWEATDKNGKYKTFANRVDAEKFADKKYDEKADEKYWKNQMKRSIIDNILKEARDVTD